MLTRSQTRSSPTPIHVTYKKESETYKKESVATPYITRSVKRKLEETDKKNIPFEFILDQILEKNSYTNSFVSDSRVSRLGYVCDSSSPTNIDFEESSRAWNKNKKRMGNGSYIYK